MDADILLLRQIAKARTAWCRQPTAPDPQDDAKLEWPDNRWHEWQAAQPWRHQPWTTDKQSDRLVKKPEAELKRERGRNWTAKSVLNSNSGGEWETTSWQSPTGYKKLPCGHSSAGSSPLPRRNHKAPHQNSAQITVTPCLLDLSRNVLGQGHRGAMTEPCRQTSKENFSAICVTTEKCSECCRSTWEGPWPGDTICLFACLACLNVPPPQKFVWLKPRMKSSYYLLGIPSPTILGWIHCSFFIYS